jgi:energy-converting hydrogenase Eha subunit E
MDFGEYLVFNKFKKNPTKYCPIIPEYPSIKISLFLKYLQDLSLIKFFVSSAIMRNILIIH